MSRKGRFRKLGPLGPRQKRRVCDYCKRDAVWARRSDWGHYAKNMSCAGHFNALEREPRRRIVGEDIDSDGEAQAMAMFGGKKWGLS